MDELISKAEVLKMIRNSMPEEITGALLYESVKLMEPEREIIQCKDCKYWSRRSAPDAPYAFGYCYCNKVWQLLEGEASKVRHIETDWNFYCGFAERKETQ